MKNRSLLIPFILSVIVFLLLSTVSVSARSEVGQAMMALPKDDAATSRMVDDTEVIEMQYEGDEDRMMIEPAVMMLPNRGEGSESGRPAILEQTLPAVLLEQRDEKREARQQRESELQAMNRAQRAQERMSDVAQSVQELLASEDRVGGIGEQVRVIAQEQQDDLEVITQNLDTIYKQNGLVKFFLGANQNAVENVREHANSIDARITRLKSLDAELTPDQQASVDQLIADLEGQRADLFETYEEASQQKGILGRFISLFSR